MYIKKKKTIKFLTSSFHTEVIEKMFFFPRHILFKN